MSFSFPFVTRFAHFFKKLTQNILCPLFLHWCKKIVCWPKASYIFDYRAEITFHLLRSKSRRMHFWNDQANRRKCQTAQVAGNPPKHMHFLHFTDLCQIPSHVCMAESSNIYFIPKYLFLYEPQQRYTFLHWRLMICHDKKAYHQQKRISGSVLLESDSSTQSRLLLDAL